MIKLQISSLQVNIECVTNCTLVDSFLVVLVVLLVIPGPLVVIVLILIVVVLVITLLIVTSFIQTSLRPRCVTYVFINIC